MITDSRRQFKRTIVAQRGALTIARNDLAAQVYALKGFEILVSTTGGALIAGDRCPRNRRAFLADDPEVSESVRQEHRHGRFAQNVASSAAQHQLAQAPVSVCTHHD